MKRNGLKKKNKSKVDLSEKTLRERMEDVELETDLILNEIKLYASLYICYFF